MARVLTNENNYYDIADTIRQMKNVNTTYKPREMSSALKDIYSNEVESTLPLSFEANGNNLLNYRIDGATGGVGDKTKNLWNDNITFENGTINQNTGADSSYASDYRIRSNFTDYIEPGQYTLNVAGVDRINTIALYSEKNIESFVESISTTSAIPKTFSLQTGGYIRVALSKVNGDVVTPSEISNIQLEEGSTATDYEPYGYKVPVKILGKNLFDKNNAEIVRLYPKGDGGLNGRATSASKSWSLVVKVKPNTHYCFSMNSPTGNSYNNRLNVGGYSNYPTNGMDATIFDTSSTRDGDYVYNTFTTDSNTNYLLVFLWSDASYTESVVRNIIDIAELQLEYGNERTEYESYTFKTSTIIIDQPLEDNESISLLDTNTNISTFDGINTLTIDTTVQPSNVYIQAPKDSIEATVIASELGEI